MDSLLLSRITKDFLNLDPDVVPPKERYRMGWGGSVLVSHRGADKQKKQATLRLLAMRERFATLFDRPVAVNLSTAPRLFPPKAPEPGSYAPPRYFSRGALDKKAEAPIPYLLVETNEMAKAQPVPGNTQLLRSLCRGKGALKRNSQGLVYLDVDNRFINMILPYLKLQGLNRPPYFNLFASPEGAHIPVIPARETAFHYLDEIEGLGQEFSFVIEGLYSLVPASWPEIEEVWFFKIQSPELENLRRRHFLTAHPGGHPFHMAVAIKPRVGTQIPRSQPILRINIAFLAA